MCKERGISAKGQVRAAWEAGMLLLARMGAERAARPCSRPCVRLKDVGEGSGPFQASTVDSLLRHHAAVQRKDLLARLAQLLNRGQA